MVRLIGGYLASLMVLAACVPRDETEKPPAIEERATTVTGTIADIRLTTSRVSETRGESNGTGGAMVGHLLGGASGAVIGATMTAKPGVTSISEVPAGCRLEIAVDDSVNVIFTARSDESTEKHYLIPCSLLRIGDEIDLSRSPPDKSGHRTYSWKVNGAYYWLDGKTRYRKNIKTDSM